MKKIWWMLTFLGHFLPSPNIRPNAKFDQTPPLPRNSDRFVLFFKSSRKIVVVNEDSRWNKLFVSLRTSRCVRLSRLLIPISVSDQKSRERKNLQTLETYFDATKNLVKQIEPGSLFCWCVSASFEVASPRRLVDATDVDAFLRTKTTTTTTTMTMPTTLVLFSLGTNWSCFSQGI